MKVHVVRDRIMYHKVQEGISRMLGAVYPRGTVSQTQNSINGFCPLIGLGDYPASIPGPISFRALPRDREGVLIQYLVIFKNAKALSGRSLLINPLSSEPKPSVLTRLMVDHTTRVLEYPD